MLCADAAFLNDDYPKKQPLSPCNTNPLAQHLA